MIKTLITATLVLIATLPSPSHAEVVNRILAVVNDEIITSYAVEKEKATILKEAERQQPPPPPESLVHLDETALNRLIDKKLVEQKVRELDIKVSEEEVRQAIEDVKRQNKLSQESLVSALANQGLSFDQYKVQIREQLERLRLVSQEVRSKIQVGEREMREYYEANPGRFGGEENFRARNIYFKLNEKMPADQVKKIMTTALTVLHEARDGKDFAELARQHSDDPAAKNTGGDLGTFRKGDILPEFEESLIKMKPGEVSDLIYVSGGLHIVKLEARFAGTPKPFEQVKAEVEDILYRKKSEERFNQWVADLRKGAAIEIRQETGTGDRGPAKP
ncbi:PpiC-type peptidyl-prolyl cis-trans isomerase [Geobacter metallireducens RCH3]|uniref:peptidylprolyl isomerase n=1 Tax=Geobacter metallireducens TaxID=28232 RepID=UPI00024A527F|nr:peptidylprolyl isomerase [Geobacter metallireducens]EHP85734.1 PpiC-type peptidyl-prolyl cis-trans isomerase [Geobacter metallireducens RCH3]